MAGLVSAIHAVVISIGATGTAAMPGGGIYIIKNRPNGTLYLGVTADLRRVWVHWEGLADTFTKRYGLKRRVYAEQHEDIRTTIQREKNMKRWPRTWKVRLILASSPDWADLYDRVSWIRGWPGRARP
jgi:putative endonuclease